jgi:hypothetical protein
MKARTQGADPIQSERIALCKKPLRLSRVGPRSLLKKTATQIYVNLQLYTGNRRKLEARWYGQLDPRRQKGARRGVGDRTAEYRMSIEAIRC